MRKKYLYIGNNSHYYHLNYSKALLKVQNNKTFEFKTMSNYHLFLRAYFHYEGLKRMPGGCFAFFITLTYNQDSLPYYLGKPCFYSKDIERFIHALRNRVQRKYNCDFEYIVTKEYGDTTERPHYHCVFYVHGLDGATCYLNKFKFKNEIDELWQGPVEEHHNDYKKMRRGHTYVGENFGEIYSVEALAYVVKYAIKDINQQNRDSIMKSLIFKQVCKDFHTFDKWCDLAEEWLNKYSYAHKKFNYERAFDLLHLDKPIDYFSTSDYVSILGYVLNNDQWYKLYEQAISDEVEKRYRDYLNLYSNKCQKSNKLGLWALESNLINYEDATIVVPRNGKYVKSSLPLYLYRKLYYEKPFIDENTGNVKYVRNDLGNMLLEKNLGKTIKRDIEELKNLCVSYKVQLQNFLDLNPNYKSLSLDHVNFRDIVVYNDVYRGRLYVGDPPPLQIKKDFHEGLINAFYDVDFRLDDFKTDLRCGLPIDFNEFAYHPVFLPLMPYVQFFDDFRDYLFDLSDKENEYNFLLYKKIKKAYGKKVC